MCRRWVRWHSLWLWDGRNIIDAPPPCSPRLGLPNQLQPIPSSGAVAGAHLLNRCVNAWTVRVWQQWQRQEIMSQCGCWVAREFIVPVWWHYPWQDTSLEAEYRGGRFRCGALDLEAGEVAVGPPAVNHRVRTQARPNGRLRFLERNMPSIHPGIASTNGAELSKKINYRKINRWWGEERIVWAVLTNPPPLDLPVPLSAMTTLRISPKREVAAHVLLAPTLSHQTL